MSTPTAMSGHAELPLSVDIPSEHQKLLREVRQYTHDIPSFDPARRTLTVLEWYVVHDVHLMVV
jgi:hypothetical protein